MGLNITKVTVDNAVKVGKGIEVLQECHMAYSVRYAPYAKRYTIYIYGKKFTGIGVDGLLNIITEICKLHLKIEFKKDQP